MENLDKNYSPKDIEERIYKKWMDTNSFSANPNKNKKPYRKRCKKRKNKGKNRNEKK